MELASQVLAYEGPKASLPAVPSHRSLLFPVPSVFRSLKLTIPLNNWRVTSQGFLKITQKRSDTQIPQGNFPKVLVLQIFRSTLTWVDRAFFIWLSVEIVDEPRIVQLLLNVNLLLTHFTNQQTRFCFHKQHSGFLLLQSFISNNLTHLDSTVHHFCNVVIFNFPQCIRGTRFPNKLYVWTHFTLQTQFFGFACVSALFFWSITCQGPVWLDLALELPKICEVSKGAVSFSEGLVTHKEFAVAIRFKGMTHHRGSTQKPSFLFFEKPQTWFQTCNKEYVTRCTRFSTWRLITNNRFQKLSQSLFLGVHLPYQDIWKKSREFSGTPTKTVVRYVTQKALAKHCKYCFPCKFSITCLANRKVVFHPSFYQSSLVEKNMTQADVNFQVHPKESLFQKSKSKNKPKNHTKKTHQKKYAPSPPHKKNGIPRLNESVRKVLLNPISLVLKIFQRFSELQQFLQQSVVSFPWMIKATLVRFPRHESTEWFPEAKVSKTIFSSE